MRASHRILILTTVVLMGCNHSKGGPTPDAGVSTDAANINLSMSTTQDSEPYIAADPADPNRLAVAWIHDPDGTRAQMEIRVRVTADQGATWSPITTIPHAVDTYISADPSLGFDSSGKLHLVFVDFKADFSGGPPPTSRPEASITPRRATTAGPGAL
jgi:hypothetical protein